MKLILSWIVVCAVLLCGGCFTNAVVTESKEYKSANFYPEAIWWNPDMATFAIVGQREAKHDRVRCHVVIPDALLAKVKNAQGEVRLSALSNLSHEDVKRLRLVDSPPPAGFVELKGETSSGVVLYRGKNVIKPGTLLWLPFAIVVDVVTLPIAIPMLASFQGVH